MLSERRDEAAATAFFMKAIGNNGWPDKVVIDNSGSNTAALFNMNCLLVMCGWCWLITVGRTKYLNNIIEQDHRFIKKLTRPMQTFKSLNSASATLDGIEVAHSPRRGAPYTFVTTDQFLVAFDLQSLRDLPDREQLEDAGITGAGGPHAGQA